jgi:hypothetical protein
MAAQAMNHLQPWMGRTVVGCELGLRVVGLAFSEAMRSRVEWCFSVRDGEEECCRGVGGKLGVSRLAVGDGEYKTRAAMKQLSLSGVLW